MPAIKPRDIPGRLVAGAYILHTGLGKWNVDEEGAAGLHATAAGAFPFLRPIPPKQFATLLSATEITVGTVLLAPVIPTAVAGLALTGFAGALVTMYLRTPTMHETGSVWPTRSGIGVSKDSWLLAMGVGLLDRLRRPAPPGASTDRQGGRTDAGGHRPGRGAGGRPRLTPGSAVIRRCGGPAELRCSSCRPGSAPSGGSADAVTPWGADNSLTQYWPGSALVVVNFPALFVVPASSSVRQLVR